MIELRNGKVFKTVPLLCMGIKCRCGVVEYINAVHVQACDIDRQVLRQ